MNYKKGLSELISFYDEEKQYENDTISLFRLRGKVDELISNYIPKTGVDLIEQERQEQIEKHGRSVEQDVALNTKGQLSVAAGILCQKTIPANLDLIPTGWNVFIWNRMLSKPYKERLIIAGALIAAEIDRIDNLPEE
jgi:hypothetical protein